MEDNRDKRSAILVAVWSLVAEHGAARVSFRNVAERAGVSPGLVQHYFGSRERLVREGAIAMIDAAAQWHYSEDMTARTALRRVVAHGIPLTDGARAGVAAWYGYVVAGFSDDSIAELLASAKRKQEREAARLIAQLRPELGAEAVARQLIATADGLALRVLGRDLSAGEAVENIDLALAEIIDRE